MAPVEGGFWGKPTATIDWCESNYEFSYYIAEMTNTISNLMMILPPIYGMFEVVKQGFERRFIYCHFLLLKYILYIFPFDILPFLHFIVVGLGSWAFHMTLLYEMQLFDELPMVWGTSVLVYCLSEVQKPPIKGKISNLPLFIFLLSFCMLFTALYLLWPQPVFQHSSYGVLVFASFLLEMQLLRKKKCKVCRNIFILSFTIYLGGFTLWNIDNMFCNSLRNLRGSIPTVFNPLTQLHGWWHCLAGYGTYLQVLFTIHASIDFRYSKKSFQNMELVHCLWGFGLCWRRKKISSWRD